MKRRNINNLTSPHSSWYDFVLRTRELDNKNNIAANIIQILKIKSLRK